MALKLLAAGCQLLRCENCEVSTLCADRPTYIWCTGFGSHALIHSHTN